MSTGNLLSSTVAKLHREACHLRHQPAYEAARATRVEFAPYPNVMSVLTALTTEGESESDTRNFLTRALLLEHRRRQSQVWVHALFAAYSPMLHRLRRRLVCSWAREDIDQEVLSSFVEVLDKVDMRNDRQHCAFLLRQGTERLVFRRLRGDREEQAELLGDDCFEVIDGQHVAEEPGAEVDVVSSAEEVLRTAGEDADLLRATVLEGQSMREYVERTVDGDEDTRRRACERLKSQRKRALAKLKASPRLRRAVAA